MEAVARPIRQADHSDAGLPLPIVNDDVAALTTLANLLRLSGNAVEAPADARAALSKLVGGDASDVFIRDIRPPDMSGYELPAQLRKVPRRECVSHRVD
ncbi:response regulator [Cognatilysobacter bugurensis]|uniref:Response regulatory domain-containing protein n=1 Tax=Cognatilysobacter bugurensis TaxID=543356 RepID=A0A918T318_9GAMM|nr:response regulator [Lysobacter bugurensis]GHA86218.1 hypothetical protein GCM10007067_25340 [Lysobacter bugurensis]